MTIGPAIAKLTPAQIRKLKARESDPGVIQVAHGQMPEVATLSDEELAAVHALEKKTGTVLVTYRDRAGSHGR